MTSVIHLSSSGPGPALRRRLPLRTARGFTLIELVAVVVIISIVAALAIPTITSRLRDRRTHQAAQTIAQLYSTARMRAMGRGAAVLVRYDGTRFEVREAVRGAAETDADCQPLPVSSCTIGNPWRLDSNPPNRLITTFDPLNRSEFEGVRMAMAQVGGAAAGAMDVCFTPMGSAWVSYSVAGALNPLAGIPVASVWRVDPSNNAVGLRRSVMIMPNGNSHLGTAQ